MLLPSFSCAQEMPSMLESRRVVDCTWPKGSSRNGQSALGESGGVYERHWYLRNEW